VLSQTIVDKDSLPLIDTCQQMPQRECVTLARLRQNDRQICRVLLHSAVLKIESLQRGAELRGGIFEVGCARADFGPSRASCTGGDEGLVAIQLESNPVSYTHLTLPTICSV